MAETSTDFYNRLFYRRRDPMDEQRDKFEEGRAVMRWSTENGTEYLNHHSSLRTTRTDGRYR